MNKIYRDSAVRSMSPNHPYTLKVSDGSVVYFETSDCFNNLISSESQLESSVPEDMINLATGPLYVEGAKKADILKIEILDIRLADQGVMTTKPGKGVLKAQVQTEATKIISIVNNQVCFNNIRLPVQPMIGVIGTSPKNIEIPNSTPGDHGSNMDCKRIKKGAKVYLPVNIDGAFLSIGDLHALMGDGEIITGLDIAGEVKVKIEVMKDEVKYPTPFVVEGANFMTIASAPTLDKAAELATKRMWIFIKDNLKLKDEDAGMLISLQGDLAICQMVNPLKTVRLEMPLSILEQYHYEIK